MVQDVSHVYLIISKKALPMSYAYVKSLQSLKTVTDWSDLLDGQPSMNPQHPSDLLIGKNHIFFHVKFEVGWFFSFTRKLMSKKKRHFHGEWSGRFANGGVYNLPTCAFQPAAQTLVFLTRRILGTHNRYTLGLKGEIVELKSEFY